MSKTRANLIDKKTGLSLNPFWINATDVPSELAELVALKNSYPKDNGNIIQLLHDTANSRDVEIACCPHAMGGLLKDTATTNAYIWGKYNDQYSGTLWYNDLTNKEVGPLDITVSETVDTVDDKSGFKTIRKLNLTNPNYFNLTASWKLYEWQESISFKRKQDTNYYLESNPVEFKCKEQIKKNSTYRIYYSNLTCDFATVEIFGLNLRVEVSKDGINWVPVKVAGGSGSGADLIIWAEDQKISEGYVDVTFDDDYGYVRIKQCWDNDVIPGTPDAGTWQVGGGGQLYPYITAVNFGFIPLVTQTTIDGRSLDLVARDTTDINLNNLLELNKETSFEYQAYANMTLFKFLRDTNTIINKQETELKTISVLRVNAPIITDISSKSIVAKCTDENKPALNFLPGHELSQAILCLSKESKPNDNPIRSYVLQPNQLFDNRTFIDVVESNTTYYLYTKIEYLVDGKDGNLNVTYSDVTKVKTPADNTDSMFKIKFRSDFSTVFADYEHDNTTITIARDAQLVAWTQEMPFYHPITTDSRGYYVEIDTTGTLLGEVTGINIEGTLSYNLYNSGSGVEEVKCLLQNTDIIDGRDFWDIEVDGKTIYGKSFKYTYGKAPVTNPDDSSSYEYHHPAWDLAGYEDTIKIVVSGTSIVNGNPIQYETDYIVLAPVARANRD